MKLNSSGIQMVTVLDITCTRYNKLVRPEECVQIVLLVSYCWHLSRGTWTYFRATAMWVRLSTYTHMAVALKYVLHVLIG